MTRTPSRLSITSLLYASQNADFVLQRVQFFSMLITLGLSFSIICYSASNVAIHLLIMVSDCDFVGVLNLFITYTCHNKFSVRHISLLLIYRIA